MTEKILVLDFGSQYAHLIAKSFRSLGYYTEIALPSVKITTAEIAQIKGIVFSGGPASVYEEKIPEFNEEIIQLGIPLLGLCYGHQLLMQKSGGSVEKARIGEFGIAQLQKTAVTCPLFAGLTFPLQVWMSHQDEAVCLGDDFVATGFTKDCQFAAVQNLSKKQFGLQFHVEVKDTPLGLTIFENFAHFCGMQKNWNQSHVLAAIKAEIIRTAKGKKVLLFLSGGVDSTVAFALLNKTLGKDRVLGLHIDNGFMRKNESAQIADRYRIFGYDNFIVEDAHTQFLAAISGKTDPQEKRHAVGETFITVRDEVVKRLNLSDGEWLLGQGTLYPDIIESGGTKNAQTIKTHHNRVEGIQRLIEKGLIIEPLKDLYKDEVRIIGKALNLSDDLINRHPFPGPGLSINVLCSRGTYDQVEFANAKKYLSEYVQKLNLSKLSEAPFSQCSVLPVKSVGVQGDFRTYCFPVALYFENLFDAFPSWDGLEKISAGITNTVALVNRTVLALYEKENCCLHEGFCTKDRLDQTREVDFIVLDELKKHRWYNTIFQHLTINLPYATEKNHCAIVLRPVVSEDVMTARFAQLDYKILQKIVERITYLDFVDAIYYDVSNKPPATFGWE